MRKTYLTPGKVLLSATALLLSLPAQSQSVRPAPAVVKAGHAYGAAPSDAVVLFDGKNLDHWQSVNSKDPAAWTLADGVMTVKPGTGPIQTKEAYGNFQLHVEWRTPSPATGDGQNRGNSGIFLQGLYELQVLDSYHNNTYIDGTAGSIYKQYPPLVNVSRPPGEWKTYDIYFTAPIFNGDGSLKSPAYVTVLQNGVFVQDHAAIKGTTFTAEPTYEKHGPLPLVLQDHGCLVSYRNIWIRPLP